MDRTTNILLGSGVLLCIVVMIAIVCYNMCRVIVSSTPTIIPGRSEEETNINGMMSTVMTRTGSETSDLSNLHREAARALSNTGPEHNEQRWIYV